MSIELRAADAREKPKVQQGNPFSQQRALVEKNLSEVAKVIAVHSGKGGVGKSTFCVNLAALLASRGNKVGLLDADVDCPSIGKMMGSKERVLANDVGVLQPLEAHGVKFVSVANMVASEDEAQIMRGPIMFKLISDMLAKTNWGELDYLIIDLPPGTGDNPLTVMQLVPLSGLIIVTQPMEVALVDARKSASMAKRFGVKIIGIVENMSGEAFGSGGAEKTAENLGVPFLGAIPLEKSIREETDSGKPAVLSHEKVKKVFEKIVGSAKL